MITSGDKIMLIAFLHGFILSAGLILPPGAQNVFLINQGANQKKFIHQLSETDPSFNSIHKNTIRTIEIIYNLTAVLIKYNSKWTLGRSSHRAINLESRFEQKPSV